MFRKYLITLVLFISNIGCVVTCSNTSSTCTIVTNSIKSSSAKAEHTPIEVQEYAFLEIVQPFRKAKLPNGCIDVKVNSRTGTIVTMWETKADAFNFAHARDGMHKNVMTQFRASQKNPIKKIYGISSNSEMVELFVHVVTDAPKKVGREMISACKTIDGNRSHLVIPYEKFKEHNHFMSEESTLRDALMLEEVQDITNKGVYIDEITARQKLMLEADQDRTTQDKLFKAGLNRIVQIAQAERQRLEISETNVKARSWLNRVGIFGGLVACSLAVSRPSADSQVSK